jgi:hypothetical protein
MPAAYSPLLSRVKSLVNYAQVSGSSIDPNLDLCYKPGVSTPSWPSLTFWFGKVDLTLQDKSKFLLVDTGFYSMAIAGSQF